MHLRFCLFDEPLDARGDVRCKVGVFCEQPSKPLRVRSGEDLSNSHSVIRYVDSGDRIARGDRAGPVDAKVGATSVRSVNLLTQPFSAAQMPKVPHGTRGGAVTSSSRTSDASAPVMCQRSPITASVTSIPMM